MTIKYEVTVVWENGASVKNAPNTGGSALHVYKKGEKFEASEIIRDNLDQNNADKLWAKISAGPYIGKFVAVRYPSLSGNPVRCTFVEIPDGGTDPDSEPSPTFPKSFTLINDETGERQKYTKVQE